MFYFYYYLGKLCLVQRPKHLKDTCEINILLLFNKKKIFKMLRKLLDFGFFVYL